MVPISSQMRAADFGERSKRERYRSNGVPQEIREDTMRNSSVQRLPSTRRNFIKGSAATVAVLASPSIVHAQQNPRLVFANWGGSWEQAMKKAWWEPFTKETGIQVTGATGNTLGRLQAMEDAKAVEWDLVEGLPELARVGAEKGLLEKIDFNVVDRSQLMKRP